MNIVEIKISGTKETTYPILIENGLLDNIYEHIIKYTCAKKFLVVTNTTVNSIYGKKLKNKNTEFIVLPDGEIHKNMKNLNKIIDRALEIKLERKDAIIALGGGVIGDMAGFAASIYQRGIDFIQIPTTLLAQVDSSVGGKVAVNHTLGKNMIGSFYQPKVVIADTSTLLTLDERQFKTGLSEVLKYAFIEKSCGSRENYNLYNFLKEHKDKIYNKDTETIKRLIEICCELKSSVVNKDEKEKGLRAILNFGHTYAHAIENITEYKKYTHGEAVSIGIKLIFNLAYKTGKITEEYYNKAIMLLNDFELLSELDFTPDKEEFFSSMTTDKKVSDSKINFVMPTVEYEVEIQNNIDKKIILQGI